MKKLKDAENKEISNDIEYKQKELDSRNDDANMNILNQILLYPSYCYELQRQVYLAQTQSQIELNLAIEREREKNLEEIKDSYDNRIAVLYEILRRQKKERLNKKKFGELLDYTLKDIKKRKLRKQVEEMLDQIDEEDDKNNFYDNSNSNDELLNKKRKLENKNNDEKKENNEEKKECENYNLKIDQVKFEEEEKEKKLIDQKIEISRLIHKLTLEKNEVEKLCQQKRKQLLDLEKQKLDLEKQIAAAKLLKDKTDIEFKNLKIDSTNKEEQLKRLNKETETYMEERKKLGNNKR